VTSVGTPVPGLAVVFQGPDGATLADLVTDATGAATTPMPTGGSVTVIRRVVEEEQMPDVRDVRGYTTGSADALKAYLDARGALRRGLIDSAERAIDRAIGQDSGFTLALTEGVRIKSWAQFLRGQPFRGLLELTERAIRQTDSLSERNRQRVIGTHALVHTDGPAAAAAARRILELDNTDVEAWDLLSYTHQAYGWQYGARPDDLREAAERVVELDGTYLPVLVRRGWIAASGGDPVDVDRQIERLARSDHFAGLGHHLRHGSVRRRRNLRAGGNGVGQCRLILKLCALAFALECVVAGGKFLEEFVD